MGVRIGRPEGSELKTEIISTAGSWIKYLGYAMLLQFIGFIVTGIMLVAEIFGLAMQYSNEQINEEQFIEAAMGVLTKYFTIYVILIVIVAIVAIITGIKLLPMKEYHILFFISGILLIIAYIGQIAGGAYSFIWMQSLTVEQLQNIAGAMSQNPIYSVGSYLTLLAYLLLGIALYLFGGTYEEYKDVKGNAVIVIIGAILILVGFGYIILFIGLILAGGKLK